MLNAEGLKAESGEAEAGNKNKGATAAPFQGKASYRFLPPFFAPPFLAAFFAVFFAMRYPPLRCGIAMSLTV